MVSLLSAPMGLSTMNQDLRTESSFAHDVTLGLLNRLAEQAVLPSMQSVASDASSAVGQIRVDIHIARKAAEHPLQGDH